MKFEVGERVQVIVNGELKTGIVTKEYPEEYEVDTGDRCHYVSDYGIAKLDQPEPSVMIPWYIDKHIRAYEEQLGEKGTYTRQDVLVAMLTDFKNHGLDGTIEMDWIDDNLKTLVEATLAGGYKIGEPIYYLKLPDPSGYLKQRKSTKSLATTSNIKEATKFTKREIKELDERYWAFAVPVEEVEAE